jgi:2-oxoisovalerate dehydrogenase E1 component alpha subunit
MTPRSLEDVQAGLPVPPPGASPLRLIDETGTPVAGAVDYAELDADRLLSAYRHMVVGRRIDAQATVLAKQGRLAVYPSSFGQEACQIGAALALQERDWLFPTYRDTVAVIARGIDPVDALGLMRGDRHCGYDPVLHRTAPQCTPLATHASHATGLAHGLRLRGREGVVALVLLGDGATCEGDFYEALNFAAVLRAPVVFLIQNNGYAISVPTRRLSATPALAGKGLAQGVPSVEVDGNDVAAVLSTLDRAVGHARSGNGPCLVEAHTYRLAPHTNADDPARYRDVSEEKQWQDRDPITRVAHYLRSCGALTDELAKEYAAQADEKAADLRGRMSRGTPLDPTSLFDHVYQNPTGQLQEQRAELQAELQQENR